MFILPKTMYRFNTITIKILNVYSQNQSKYSKMLYEPQAPTAILRKKNKVKGIMLSNSKLYYKTILIKTAWYWHKIQTYRLMEQNKEPPNKPTSIGSINI